MSPEIRIQLKKIQDFERPNEGVMMCGAMEGHPTRLETNVVLR